MHSGPKGGRKNDLEGLLCTQFQQSMNGSLRVPIKKHNSGSTVARVPEKKPANRFGRLALQLPEFASLILWNLIQPMKVQESIHELRTMPSSNLFEVFQCRSFHRKDPEQVMIPLRTPNNRQTDNNDDWVAVTCRGTAVKGFWRT